MGGLLGLRYEGCAVILADYGLRHEEVWEGLRVIEAVRVEEAAKKREHDHGRRRR